MTHNLTNQVNNFRMRTLIKLRNGWELIRDDIYNAFFNKFMKIIFSLNYKRY